MNQLHTTPEGYALARPLLLPHVLDFTDLFDYVREWDHASMTHTSGKVPRPDLIPEPRYIPEETPKASAWERTAWRNDGRNVIGPYASVDLSQIGGLKHRGIAVRATDAVMDALRPRIVTPDDHLSFRLIAHKHDDKPARVLVIAEHGYIIGSHYLAYIDPQTIPAYPYTARDTVLRELAEVLRAADHVPFRRDLDGGAREYTCRTLPGYRVRVESNGNWSNLGTVDPTYAPAPPAPKPERRTLVRDMPNRSRVVAHLEIRHPGGTLSAGFSLTGEVYEPHGTWSGAARMRNGRDCDSGGQCTEEILRAFPRLTPFAAVHLSDLDGTPMHAEANARWFLSPDGDAYAREHGLGSGYAIACRTLRVESIPAGVLAGGTDGGVIAPAWAAFLGDRREAWAYDAWEARRIFDAIPSDTSTSQED